MDGQMILFFKKWIDKIFFDYQNNINKKCLLLLDRASSNITSNILDHLKNNNIEYAFIPGKLTTFLQPLNIGINKQFKSHLSNKYLL